MAYLMLYGNGWTQRWQVEDQAVATIEEQIDCVGTDKSGSLAIVDPVSGQSATLRVAWRHVAAALLLDSDTTNQQEEPSGSYR